MYRVIYEKAALMPDGTVGNCALGRETVYTDHPLQDIPNALRRALHERKLVPHICKIERVKGWLLPVNPKTGQV